VDVMKIRINAGARLFQKIIMIAPVAFEASLPGESSVTGAQMFV